MKNTETSLSNNIPPSDSSGLGFQDQAAPKTVVPKKSPSYTMLKGFGVTIVGISLHMFSQFLSVFIVLFFMLDQADLADPFHSIPTKIIYISQNKIGLVLLVNAFLSILLISLWLFITRKTILPIIQREKIKPMEFILLLPATFTLLIVVTVYMALISWLSQIIPIIKFFFESYQLNSVFTMNTLSDKIFLILSVGILIPLVEEIIFRGIIFNYFRKAANGTIAIFLSALFFGLFHMQPIQIVYAFICGLFLGWMYHQTKSFTLVVGIHIIFNLFGGVIPTLLAEKNSMFASFLLLFEFLLGFMGVLSLIYLFKKPVKSISWPGRSR